jgi:hypothetical protein
MDAIERGLVQTVSGHRNSLQTAIIRQTKIKP